MISTSNCLADPAVHQFYRIVSVHLARQAAASVRTVGTTIGVVSLDRDREHVAWLPVVSKVIRKWLQNSDLTLRRDAKRCSVRNRQQR